MLGALWDCCGAGCGRLITLPCRCKASWGRQACADAAQEQWLQTGNTLAHARSAHAAHLLNTHWRISVSSWASVTRGLCTGPCVTLATHTFRSDLRAVMSDACATVAVAVCSKAVAAGYATNAVRGSMWTAALPSAES